jgi:FkbM family methyltransferase
VRAYFFTSCEKFWSSEIVPPSTLAVGTANQRIPGKIRHFRVNIFTVAFADHFPIRSFFGQAIRLPLKLIPAGTAIPVLSGPNRGRRLIKGYGPASYWLGIAERPLQKVAKDNIRAGDIVYDIGANVGLHTLYFSHLAGENGHVFAFEPAPDTARKLSQHLTLNKVKNVTVIQKAVTDRVEEKRFHLHEDPCQRHLDKNGEISVSTTSLDTLIHELPPPDCIKMDIEGGEVEAFAGGQECFRTHRPKLFLASHFGSDVKCCEMLRSWGYKIKFFEDKDLVAIPV